MSMKNSGHSSIDMRGSISSSGKRVSFSDTLSSQQRKESFATCQRDGCPFLNNKVIDELGGEGFSEIMEKTSIDSSNESDQQDQIEFIQVLENRERSQTNGSQQSCKKNRIQKRGSFQSESSLKKTDSKKFKTELCKNWSEKGRCQYGKKCQFAHGKPDLHNKIEIDHNMKYRSKKCKFYETQESCSYGQRCQFIHENRTVREIQDSYLYQKTIQNPEPYDDEWNLSEYSVEHKINFSHIPEVRRCHTLVSIEDESLQRQRCKSEERNPVIKSVMIRSNSQNKQMLQKWVDNVLKGVIITMHVTSSDDMHSTPSSQSKDNLLCDRLFLPSLE